MEACPPIPLQRREKAISNSLMPLIEHTLRRITKKLMAVRGGNRLIEPVRRHFVKQYTGRPEGTVIINDFDGDLKLRIDRASYMGSLIYWRGYHSLNELFCLKQLLSPEMVFADVGANQGEFTTFAAKYVRNGRVLSFEPLHENFAVLTENVELNQFRNVQLFDCGLGETQGSLEIYTSEDLTAHGSWHEGLGSLYRTDYRSKSLGSVRIEIFDEQFAKSGCTRLDGMKIDVEGAELFVLKGAAETIQKFHPFLMLEINEETYQAAGYSKRDVVERLTGWGYRMFKIGRRGRRVEVDPSQLPDFCCTLWLPCMS